MGMRAIYVLLALAGLLSGSAVGLWQGLPILVHRYVVKGVHRAAASTGQQAQWSHLQLDGYETLAIEGLQLRAANAPPGEPALLEVERLLVHVDPASVFTGKVRLLRVELEAPRVTALVREDGSSNFDEPLRRLRSASGSAASNGESSSTPSSDSSLLRYFQRILPHIVVTGASLGLEVRDPTNRLKPWSQARVSDARLQLRDKSPLAGEHDLHFEWSGHVTSSGAPDALTTALSVQGRFGWPSRALALGFSLDAPLELPVGDRVLRVGGLDANLDGPLRFTEVSLSQPGVDDPLVPPAVAAQRVDVFWKEQGPPVLEGMSPKAWAEAVAEIRIVEPVVVFHRNAEGETNFNDLRALAQRIVSVARPSADPSAPSTQRAAPTTAAAAPLEDNAAKAALIALFTKAERVALSASALAFELGARFSGPDITVERGVLRYSDEVWMLAGHQGRADAFNLKARRPQGGEMVELDLDFVTADSQQRPARNLARLRVNTVTRDVQVELGADALPLAPYAPLFPERFPVSGGTEIYRTKLLWTWSEAQQRAQVEAVVNVREAAAFFPSVSETLLRFGDIGVEAVGAMHLADHRWTVDRLQLRLGNARARLSGKVDNTTTAPSLALDFQLPETPCQDIFDGLPPGLVPVLEGLQIDGTLSWQASVKVNSSSWKSFDLQASDPIFRGVRVRSMGSVVRFDRLRGPFHHTVEEPDGSMLEFLTGPGARDYIMYTDISPWMTKVITTTEDGRFFRHQGFSPNSIRESIVANLEKAKFVRGASTVSQQLAKNLYLSRSKTISRKVQEAIITWQMENHLTKNEMLELYFNVIEFGPSIYGIKRAAHHYFRKHPRDLDLLECLFLASLIPSPKRYYSQFTRGEVTDGWRTRLRFVGNAMKERGKIDQTEFDALGDFSPRFWNSPNRAPVAEPGDSNGALDPDELPDLIDNTDQGEPGILFDPAD